MGIKERKEREKDQRRELIINAAKEIMAEEGLDNLSIRKIANRIEYSPAIIYHYFKDKDEIVTQLMTAGYKKIVDAISSSLSPGGEPEDVLRRMTRQYIEVALQMSDEFKTIQLDSSPGVLEYTASLFKGAAAQKPALKILYQCLKGLHKDKDLSDNWFELTAQVMTTTTFGLIVKLILEKDVVSEEQKERLIEHAIECIIDGMVLRKPL